MNTFGALEAGGTKMVCAICTEDGQILKRISIPTETPDDTIPKMVSFFKDNAIAALGIGTFGPVDLCRDSPDYGTITDTPKLAWKNYPIVHSFAKALNVPVGIDTDVNAAAVGEHTWGSTKDVRDSIYITVGTGIGVGVIIDGVPHHGLMHPEGGHISVPRHPNEKMAKGVCPYHDNCLEGWASGPAIEARWGTKAENIALTSEAWDLEAYYLAQAICCYIMTLSPERIVLGGGVMHQIHLIKMIREQVYKQINGYINTDRLGGLDNYIVPASLNDNQGILGSLKIGLEEWKLSL